ncbi:MAG: HlyC/CorC family transporter [Tissierellia bacterium]|nr:HlyC/CorC family transporter [Tissierellia bacterium]
MGPDTIQLIILVLLLAMSAFFSASETALMSLSKIKVRNMIEDKKKGAKIVDKLISNPSKLLSAILVGNNLVNIGASALATSLAISYFGASGVGIATAITTVLVLIFGEITPKSLAATYSEKIALVVAKPLRILTKLLSPITAILMFVTNGIIRLFGGNPDEDKPFITEEELRTMVQVSHEEGVLQVQERKIIDNVFEFRASQVKDVMTTRTDMVAVEDDITYTELLEIFRDERFSRLPVYEGTIDNIVGVIYVKDLVFHEADRENFDIREFMREPFFTYEFQRISRLFEQLRTRRIALAIVLDEYGGTAGVTTLEDLVEEIVGDLEDEYDEISKDIEPINDHEFNIMGNAEVDEVNEKLHLGIDTDDFDTLGGFVFGEIGRLPEEGDEVIYKNLTFRVLSLDKNRIEKLRVIIDKKQ